MLYKESIKKFLCYLEGKDYAAKTTIQRILGHENLATTSIYLHSDLSDMRDAMEGTYSTKDRERREDTWAKEISSTTK